MSRLVPAPDRSRIIRVDVDADISRRLSESPVVTISGIALLGKSAAAAAYATDHEDQYDLAIWLDAGKSVGQRNSRRSLWCEAAKPGTSRRSYAPGPVC